MPDTLPVNQIIGIHERLVEVFSESGDPIAPPGIRERGLIESASNRPKTGLGKIMKYTTVVMKGAALFHSLVANHAFHNGNKRTALVSLVTYLDENHRRLIASDEEIFDFVVAAAQGYVPGTERPSHVDILVTQIGTWIEQHSQHVTDTAREMKINEFLMHVVRIGARVETRRESFIIFGSLNKSIRVSRSTRKLGGTTIRRYLRVLGLTESKTGITFQQFQAGLVPEQAWTTGLMAVLRRLAHA